MILSDPQERSRFLRFAVVGIIGAIVDFGTFNLLTGVFYLGSVLSSVCSFTAAITSNFLWNRFWTYPDSRTKNLTKQIVQFFLVSAIGLAIRTPLFVGLEKVLVGLFERSLPKPFMITPTFAGHNLSLAIAVLVVMMWNFLVNRYWTYNDVG